MAGTEANPYSGGVYTCSKLKLDSLFLRWFSLPQSQQLVLRLLDDLKEGRTLTQGNNASFKKISPSNVHTSTPPLSPKKNALQVRKGRLNHQILDHGSHCSISSNFVSVKEQNTFSFSQIPRFYFPKTGQDSIPAVHGTKARILDFLKPFGEGLPLVALKTLLREQFGLPVSLGFALHKKLASLSESQLPVSTLLEWLDTSQFVASSQAQRLFDILRSSDRDFVTPEDLRPVVLGIIVSHPGLAFLKGAAEFQDRYAETVIYRIFYSLNSSGAKRLSARDIELGRLLDALLEVEGEEDVNSCTRFFSYEHFYVIYCKFWDLDTDHDFLLSRDDLLRYGNHSLTYRIADRIFSGAARPLSSGIKNKMGYEDFVWFILSEEDKTSNSGLDYWFRACDLTGDGKLTQDELLWFYEEQMSRMECLSQEVVTFDDIMSQMLDMLNPEDLYFITMRDLKRSRQMAGTLFNVLFNLTKFVAFEMRDPFTMRQEREEAAMGATEWDRFARAEYLRLAVESDIDQEDGEDGSMPWT